MKTGETYCGDCNAKTTFTINGRVPQKINMYYVECEKGHEKEMFISKNLFEALKNTNS